MPGRRRAVVAHKNIRREQLVERAPVLVVEEEERAIIDASSIGAHIFMWEHGSVGDDLYSGKGRAAVVLGLASLVTIPPRRTAASRGISRRGRSTRSRSATSPPARRSPSGRGH